MGRAPCCDKANVKKGPWSPEEDAKLKSYIELHGTGGNWITLPQKIGLKRCGKSCRLRWLNYLRPNIKHGGFSDEEDNVICSLYMTIGSRWSVIAAQLPGRTDNDVKNYWNTRLKKKLLGRTCKDIPQRRRSPREIRPTQTENINCQAPYCPGLSLPFLNEDKLATDDSSSLRNFLVKLCDRLAIENPGNFNNSLQNPYTAPQVHEGVNDIIDTASWTHSFVQDSPSMEGVFSRETGDCFDPELEQLLYSEQVKVEGVDRLWDMSCISSSGSSSWNNVATFVSSSLEEQVELWTC